MADIFVKMADTNQNGRSLENGELEAKSSEIPV